MIKNIQRDGLWINSIKSVAEIPWSNAAGSGGILMNSDGIVYNHVGAARAEEANSTTTTGFRLIGVQMAQPPEEITPYRVKIYKPNGSGVTRYLIIGYLDTVTGTDDPMTTYMYIPLTDIDHFDELIMIPPLDTADTDYGKPIGFGIANASAGTSTHGLISVQNLAISPPSMAMGVS